MPDALYMTAIFLCGEWGVCDFTLGGRAVAAFMCIAGIAIAAIPIGSRSSRHSAPSSGFRRRGTGEWCRRDAAGEVGHVTRYTYVVCVL